LQFIAQFAISFIYKFMAEYRLRDFDLYKEAVSLSFEAWELFKNFDWQVKKIIGDQFIRSIDSIGANIAEGYGRFHYGDRVRFCYNSRGSLLEAKHWVFLLYQRKIIEKGSYDKVIKMLDSINIKLNAYIKSLQQKRQ
jgi:four helix bundle protein